MSIVYSAVRNRIASVGSGLFLEDELDVVGKRFENIIIESRPYPSSRNATSGGQCVLCIFNLFG